MGHGLAPSGPRRPGPSSRSPEEMTDSMMEAGRLPAPGALGVPSGVGEGPSADSEGERGGGGSLPLCPSAPAHVGARAGRRAPSVPLRKSGGNTSPLLCPCALCRWIVLEFFFFFSNMLKFLSFCRSFWNCLGMKMKQTIKSQKSGLNTSPLLCPCAPAPRCFWNCLQFFEIFGFFRILLEFSEILLPSAVHLEERLTVSQSVSEPAGRQSGRQSDRYTQFGFFVSGRCGPNQQRGPTPQVKQWPGGNAAGAHP